MKPTSQHVQVKGPDRQLFAISPRSALVVSTCLAAAGFAVMTAPLGFAGLCVGLVVAGVGSARHPG